MDYDSAIAYMGGLLRFGVKLGDARIRALCARVGNPQDRYRIVHVTGTKGKGSTTAMAAAMLQAQGYRVGGYYSPYVYDVRERVTIDGQPISREEFAEHVTTIRPHIEALASTDLGQTTEFELKTLVGFMAFARHQVDYACIEVGIGGRLDATNVVHPDVTVITNVGLDHTEILGATHAAIAGEKAGIIKTGVPCITAAHVAEAAEVIAETAAIRSAPLITVGPGETDAPTTANPGQVNWSVQAGEGGCSVGYDREFGRVCIATSSSVYGPAAMRLGGLYQRENAACAVAAVEQALARRAIKLQPDSVANGLAQATLPGRLTVQQLQDGPLVVLDGAHNRLAAEGLGRAVAALQAHHRLQRILLVVGMIGGHSPGELMTGFAESLSPATVYATRPEWKRGQDVEVVAGAASSCFPHVVTAGTVPDAVRTALDNADASTLVLVTGSFYTVGEVCIEQLVAWWESRSKRRAGS